MAAKKSKATRLKQQAAKLEKQVKSKREIKALESKVNGLKKQLGK